MDSDTPVYPEHPSRESAEMSEPDDLVQYFCKLTFGQFFTLVVLLVMTLCSSFYLGARYGNQYLRIGEMGRPQVAVTPTMQPVTVGAPMPEAVREDERLKQLAREALSAQQRSKLEGQMQDMLAAPTPPQPTTTSIPPAPESDPMVQYGAEHANTAPPVNPSPVASATQPADKGDQSPDNPLPVARGQLPEQQFPVNQGRLETGNRQPEAGALVAAREGVPAPAAIPPDEAGGLVKVKSAGGMQYSVQIGAYQDQREAAYFAEEWKIKGYPAYMMMADLGDRGRWYRVRLGGFPTKEDAERYLTELKTKESIDGIIVYNEQ